MGGVGFKPRRLVAIHEVWSIVERMRWSVYTNVVVKRGWIMKHFQWSWESAYILRAKSLDMLCEKHI